MTLLARVLVRTALAVAILVLFIFVFTRGAFFS